MAGVCECGGVAGVRERAVLGILAGSGDLGVVGERLDQRGVVGGLSVVGV